MDQSSVQWAVDTRGVATVTLNRPEVNNAYNGELLEAMRAHLLRLAAQDRVRAIVIRGAGRHFQAGADISWFKAAREADDEANLRASRIGATFFRDLMELPCPTIALIHGACFGGGTGIAAACDIVVASSDAIFSISEARWGFSPGFIFPALIAAIGTGNVRRYAMTCERFDAAKAKEIGFVDELCEPGKLDEAAAPLIEALLLAAPGAIREAKQQLLAISGLATDDARLDWLIRMNAARRKSAEAGEGIASFFERRKPNWYPGGPP